MSIFNNGLIYFLVNESGIIREEWQYAALNIAFILIAIAVSYLMGSINSAIIISRAIYGEDVRSKGSGNAGLTNMLRNYGKKGALLTLLGDVLKTVVAICFTALLFGFGYNQGISLNDGYCYVSALFVVLGHVFPIFYNFKGGKGVLVTAVSAFILTPIPALVLLLIFIFTVATSKYVSLGSVTVAVLYPVLVSFYVKLMFGGQGLPGILALCVILLAIFIVWCHRENLKRISNRTENKISFNKKTDE